MNKIWKIEKCIIDESEIKNIINSYNRKLTLNSYPSELRQIKFLQNIPELDIKINDLGGWMCESSTLSEDSIVKMDTLLINSNITEGSIIESNTVIVNSKTIDSIISISIIKNSTLKNSVIDNSFITETNLEFSALESSVIKNSKIELVFIFDTVISSSDLLCKKNMSSLSFDS